MATKAAKSITINATKYELANALAINDDKIQLKAKDVVLDEIDAPSGSEAIFVFNHYDSDEGYYVTDAIKDIEGNTLTNAQACKKVKAGAQIYVQVEAASGSNTGKFQLLDNYEHEEMGGGSVIQEHFWSEDNAFSKYISMTFRLADNFVSAPNITDATGGGVFVITLDDEQDLSVAGSKTCTTFTAADLIAAIQAGKTIKIVAHEVFDSNDNYTNDVMLIPSCRYSDEGVNIWMSAEVNTLAGHKAWDILCGAYGNVSSVTFIDATNKPAIVEARLTSDMSLVQVGGSAGWRGMSFPATPFSDIVDMLSDFKTVYIALAGSTNKLTAFAPLTLTRRFATDMWSPELTFVADGSVFTINDTPEIKRG